MRGEHPPVAKHFHDFPGSSPHARGALSKIKPALTTARIIPACAGSTCAASVLLTHVSDHPRMRGEHEACFPVHGVGEGSSPHARGARCCQRAEDRQTGIIPACAGSTADVMTICWESWDHPRMRGEHPCRIPAVRGYWGSSPRERGAQLDFLGNPTKNKVRLPVFLYSAPSPLG